MGPRRRAALKDQTFNGAGGRRSAEAVAAPLTRREEAAGASISGGKGRAEDKIAALEAAGIRGSPSLARLGSTLVEVPRKQDAA